MNDAYTYTRSLVAFTGVAALLVVASGCESKHPDVMERAETRSVERDAPRASASGATPEAGQAADVDNVLTSKDTPTSAKRMPEKVVKIDIDAERAASGNEPPQTEEMADTLVDRALETREGRAMLAQAFDTTTVQDATDGVRPIGRASAESEGAAAGEADTPQNGAKATRRQRMNNGNEDLTVRVEPTNQEMRGQPRTKANALTNAVVPRVSPQAQLDAINSGEFDPEQVRAQGERTDPSELGTNPNETAFRVPATPNPNNPGDLTYESGERTSFTPDSRATGNFPYESGNRAPAVPNPGSPGDLTYETGSSTSFSPNVPQ